MAVSTGAAILGGSVLSAVGAKAGGDAAARGMDQAAKAERARLAQLQPFQQAGTRALPAYEANIGETPTYAETVAGLESDPGYMFELEQGQKAIQGSAAARGLLRSGRTLKDLVKYAQGLATTRAGDAFSRDMNAFTTKQNQLLALIESGRGASGVQSSLPQIAMAQGENRANLYGNLANVGTNALQQMLLANQLQGSAGSAVSKPVTTMGPSGPIVNQASVSWGG